MNGEYTLRVPIGAYNVTASKDSCTQTAENVEVLKDQTIILNIQLGGENMEHTFDISITNCEEETITVPDGCANKSYKFVGAISENPVVGKTVKLLTADGTTVLRTQITDVDGVVTFTDAVYGNYKLRII